MRATRSTKPNYDQSFWEQLWSKTLHQHPDKVAHRTPNAHLIAEVGGLRPGRALDAGCGHGADTLWLASITWSLVSTMAPERLLGLTGGVFNFAGNLSGITVPIIIGYLARDFGFSAGLTYVTTLALLGALSYMFVVGKVERLPSA